MILAASNGHAAITTSTASSKAVSFVLDLVLCSVSFYPVHRRVFLTATLTMLHRILLLLLIGTTLLGPSVCCCTMRVSSAESSESPCCCCQQDDSAKSCPTNSEGDRKHDCPCRKHRAVGAKLDDSQVLPTSPSVKWMLELSEICSSALFLSADELSPQRNRLPPCRFDSMPTGTAVLIAHCVRRC